MATIINKICPVCKKHFEIEIKRINAGGGKYCSYQCAGEAKYKGGRIATTKRYREKHKKKHNAFNLVYNRKYRKTVRGCLILLFHKMKERCESINHYGYYWYGNRGIKCLFVSSKEFANYVINDLKVDPRGLEIHRINNDGHYEPGNVEFLTSKEHGLKHRKAG